MDDYSSVLNARRCLYFKSHDKIYCLNKENQEYKLFCWDGDNWVGDTIKEHTALTIMRENSVICSLQQAYMWILESENRRESPRRNS